MPRARHALAPGVVEIRLNGDSTDVVAVLEILGGALAGEGARIIKQSGPYDNREDPGVRAYTTVELAPRPGQALSSAAARTREARAAATASLRERSER